MFCIYLRTNSDLCHLQHKLIGFYDRDEKCLQRGTDWGFKYSGLRLVIEGLNSNLMHKILIYLHIMHLLKSSTCFEHYPAHLQEVYVVIEYMQPLVSSLSAVCVCLAQWLFVAKRNLASSSNVPTGACHVSLLHTAALGLLCDLG